MSRAGFAFSLLFLTAPALAAPPTVAEARSSLVGKWTGKLEYRDYQADRWFGLPVVVEVKDGGDGVTLIRTADYDDGPTTGIVRITTVSMLHGTAESVATFRKGRAVELEKVSLAVDPASRDKANWTMVETSDGMDDDRPATIRVTTVRSGPSVTSTKEIRFTGEDKWLTRNRTVLKQ
jgi:hypothetical protein